MDRRVRRTKNKLLDDFKNVISSHNSTSLNCNEPYSLMIDTLSYIDKNSDILSIFLGPHANADSIFIEHMKEMMKELCINVRNKLYPNATQKNYDYYYSFAFYGFIGLIQD